MTLESIKDQSVRSTSEFNIAGGLTGQVEQTGLSLGILPGGGTQGLISVYLAEEFESQTGADFHTQFDSIHTVSVGSINGGALWPLEETGAPLLTTEELKDFYLHGIDDAFKTNYWSLGGLIGHKYDISGLEDAIDEVFGDIKLSDYANGFNIYVVDLKTQGVKILSSDQAKLDPSQDFYMRDLTRTAIAAPYYFEPIEIKNLAGEIEHFVDGGVWANSPAFRAYFDAVSDGTKPENITMTVFGTGHTEQEPVKLEDIDGGASEIANTVKLMFNARGNSHNEMLRERLGQRYIVLDTDLSGSDIGIVADDIAKVVPYAQQAVRENMSYINIAANNILELRGQDPATMYARPSEEFNEPFDDKPRSRGDVIGEDDKVIEAGGLFSSLGINGLFANRLPA